MTAQAPAGAAYASVVLYTGVAEASLYFDDITLRTAAGVNVPLANPGFEPAVSVRSVAAETLVEYVYKSTGATLPVISADELPTGGDPDEVVIRLGTAASVAGDDPALDALLADLGDDGFVIHAAGNRLTIAGPTIWGTNNGVFDFLERYVGVRWLMPGAAGEDVPSLSGLTVSDADVREQPAFGYRVFSPLHDDPANDKNAIQVQQQWAQHNRMQGFYNAPIAFHHNLYSLFPVEIYGQTHPEFYPKGVPPAPGVQINWQPCFSEEGTIDAAVAGILAYFQANPDVASFSLGVNDGGIGSFCEANPVQAYYSWVNEVVERVLQVYPDKWFGLLAYHVLETPPSFTLNPRVVPFITNDRTAWADAAVRSAGHSLTEEWLQAASQIGYYDYIYGSPYLVPRVYPHLMADNYRYAHDHGVAAQYAELYPNWGEGPKPWIAAKLQWNPDTDVDDLLDEWYERAVGPDAAPYLAAYYDHWEQFWTERAPELPWFLPGATYQNFTDPSYLEDITAEEIADNRELLETVVAEADTPERQTRASMLLRAFEYYEASMLSYPRAVEPPADENEALALLEQGVDSFDERMAMAVKRTELLDEFKLDPALKHGMDARSFSSLVWSGWNTNEFWALIDYMKEWEPSGGALRDEALSLAQNAPTAEARGYAALLLDTAEAPSLTQNPSFESGNGDTAPPWELLDRSTSTRAVARSTGAAYSGTVSMQVYGRGWGGPTQTIDVQPGFANLKFRYHIPTGGNTAVSMQWGFDLLDAQGNWLSNSTVRSAVTSLAAAEGSWLEAELAGEIPQTVRGTGVKKVRLLMLVDSAAPVEVYIDDVQFFNAVLE